MLLACTPLSAATVYKWVDAQGVTHYSDQPHPGAEKIVVGSAQTYSAEQARRAPPPRAADREETDDAVPYRSCEIVLPKQDEVLFNVYSLSGELRLQPQLRDGDRVVLILDGQQLEGVATGSGPFTIPQVYRGTHTLAATVMDAQGVPVCRSGVVTFHVRQPSVQAPNPANRPRF